MCYGIEHSFILARLHACELNGLATSVACELSVCPIMCYLACIECIAKTGMLSNLLVLTAILKSLTVGEASGLSYMYTVHNDCTPCRCYRSVKIDTGVSLVSSEQPLFSNTSQTNGGISGATATAS